MSSLPESASLNDTWAECVEQLAEGTCVYVTNPPCAQCWWSCCSTGRFHSSGRGIAAGPRPSGVAPSGKRYQGEGASASATHRCTERRHQGRRPPPPEWPQRWRGVQGTVQAGLELPSCPAVRQELLWSHCLCRLDGSDVRFSCLFVASLHQSNVFVDNNTQMFYDQQAGVAPSSHVQFCVFLIFASPSCSSVQPWCCCGTLTTHSLLLLLLLPLFFPLLTLPLFTFPSLDDGE